MIHKKELKERYELISKLVGKNKKVFELGCGTCLVKNYLDESCSYEGWDLNQKFVNHAKKKGLNVKLKNVFDFLDYPENEVILIIDILHHIVPNHEKLIDEAKKRSKKLIILEPYISSDPLFNSKGLMKKICMIYYKFFADFDGINPLENIFKWDYDEKSLKKFFEQKGAKQVTKIGSDLISVF